MTLELFIEYNFAPIIGLIFQIVILIFSKNFSKRDKLIFVIAIILEVIELLAYNLEYIYSSYDYKTNERIFYSIIGYIVRPAMVYPFILLLADNTFFKNKKYRYLDLIPLVIVIIIQQFAWNTNLVFYFTDDNHYKRGILGGVSEYVTIFYLLETAILMIIAKVSNRKFNSLLMIVIFLYIVFSIVFESIFSIRSLGISACVFSIVFFMFALQTNYLNDVTTKLTIISEIDSLSKLYNRYSGERKIDKLAKTDKPGVFAIIDIDKFKTINDTYGHSIGDEAIIKIAKVLKETVPPDDIVMRLGGDEFAIYSTHIDEIHEETSINILFDRIDQIRLSADKDYRVTISVGISRHDENSTSFDKLYKEADVKLYEAKKHFGNYCEE